MCWQQQSGKASQAYAMPDYNNYLENGFKICELISVYLFNYRSFKLKKKWK